MHTQFNTTEFEKQPVVYAEIDNAEKDVIQYYDQLKEKFRSQIAEYQVEGKHWNHIRYVNR